MRNALTESLLNIHGMQSNTGSEVTGFKDKVGEKANHSIHAQASALADFECFV